MAAKAPKRAADKAFTDALRRAVCEKDKEGRPILDALARAWVAQGLTGDTTALRDMANRLDGTPAATVNGSMEHKHTMVAELPVTAPTVDEWTAKHGPH